MPCYRLCESSLIVKKHSSIVLCYRFCESLQAVRQQKDRSRKPDGLSMFDAHDSRQRVSTRFFVYEAFLNRKCEIL